MIVALRSEVVALREAVLGNRQTFLRALLVVSVVTGVALGFAPGVRHEITDVIIEWLTVGGSFE